MDEFVHMLKMAAQQGTDVTPFRYGHIASYDPSTHRVRCIIPSMTDQDGNPMLSGWMPMGTLSAGGGYGVQVIYKGGATAQNPTAGEQVLIAVFDRQRGVAAVPCMFFGGGITPPNGDLPQQSDGFQSSATAGAPGDVIISAPPAQTGGANSVVRLRQNGDIEIWGAGQLNANVIGDSNIMVGGNATLTAVGTVSIFGAAIMLGKAAGDTLLTLCTSIFQALFNSHTHLAGDSPTSAPIQQADASTMTSVVTGE